MNISGISKACRPIATTTLIALVATGVCAFLSACSTPYQRHDARVDARVENRVERRHDRL